MSNTKTYDFTAKWYQGCGSVIEGEEHEKIAALQEMEQSGDYYAQPKCDGIWAAAFGENDGTRAFSRNCQEKEGHGLPYVGDGNCIVGELGYGSQESVARRAKLGHSFMDVFDVLWLDGKYVGDLDERKRRSLLKGWWYRLPKDMRKHFILLPVWKNDFVRRYQDQHEGLVLKRCNLGAYHPGTKHKEWIKFKKEQDYDVVIMDWTLSTATTKIAEPMAKNVVIGQYVDGRLKTMGKVGSLSHKLSREIALDFDSFDGKVIVVRAYCRFESGSLRHPKLAPFVGDYPFRTDKDAEDCVWIK